MANDGGLEASDFNDGDILSQTTQIPCKGGHQFKYILPDGHPLTSECINAENKAKALHLWVDAVKQAAVARDKEIRQETAARAKRAKIEREEQEARQLIVPAGTTPDAPVLQETLPMRSSSVAGQAASAGVSPNLSTDPVALAKAEMVRAALEVQELAPKLAAAQQRVAQWKAVLNALQAVELPKESSVIETPNAQTVRDLLLETR